jgi:hypothetical protein
MILSVFRPLSLGMPCRRQPLILHWNGVAVLRFSLTILRQIMRGLTQAAAILIFMFVAASNGHAQIYVFERLWLQFPQPWYFGDPQ